jgi:hypothetical protein
VESRPLFEKQYQCSISDSRRNWYVVAGEISKAGYGYGSDIAEISYHDSTS